jgi:UDP-glucose 4-epimerase
MDNMNRNVLVTGSKGFIGHQTVLQLQDQGFNVFGVDWAKDLTKPGLCDSFDSDTVRTITRENDIKTVMHFAADHEVGRSVEEPSVFYNNNVASSIKFLDRCIQAGVENFIFSSSSSVYGNTEVFPTIESTPKNPLSPYGRTKDMFEEILKDYERAYGIKTLSLRYFNAAGADPYNRHGYEQETYSHLIPILAKCFKENKEFTVFGTDYDTPDGTCIRDYTHVWDIAQAHINAVPYLFNNGSHQVFNIGKGNGESVYDVYKEFILQTGTEVKVNKGERREGDPSKTFADIELAMTELNWTPKYNMKDIVEHAIAWENR